jgi:hypothetical protein
MAIENILLMVIPAAFTLAGVFGGRFLEHRLGMKREIREARRKYRGEIVTPVKEALTKLLTDLRFQSLFGQIDSIAEEKGISLSTEELKDIKELKGLIRGIEVSSKREAAVDFVALAAAINKEDVRERVERALLLFAMGEDMRRRFNITNQDMKEAFSLAYQKLEDFATLAD